MNNHFQYIQTKIKNRIGYIVLNRPDKRNALNSVLIDEIKKVLHIYKNEENIKIVVLKANGNSFCAGADLEYLTKLQSFDYEDNLKDSNSLRELYEQIYNYDKIVIAQVEGHAIAGGSGLVIVCDFAFSVPDAKFGFTEVKIGFVPALVSFFLIRKIGEAKARDLLLTGKLISAKLAMETEMINSIYTNNIIDEKVYEFADELAKNVSSESIKITKQIISDIQHFETTVALKRLAEINARARGTKDCKKGISGFLNKKQIEW
ncbi:MAG: enoyl-CoA hydratase/isomerase family protein [Chlorobi bacterium]|nr:enoyl-CoA hydratase/isomerase family protein [Chlorobiota bacterium]